MLTALHAELSGKPFKVFILLVSVFVGAVFSTAPSVYGQPRNTDWRAKRKSLDREFADQLQDIALWCRDVGLPQQVSQTFAVYNNRDLHRQYIYLPTPRKMPAPRAGKLGQWLDRITTAKVKHAARIYTLANKAADEGANAIAFQLLHEVIHFDHDHQAARAVLGHKEKEDVWQINNDRLRVKKNRPDHPLLKWPGGSYLTVITPHFTIDSSATEEETVQLAENLEKWHDVWRQVFFEYWTPASVKRWIEKKISFKEPKRRYKVAFFKNHQQYVASLSTWVKGVGVSTGYYNQDLELSFFSAGNDQQNIDTWKHELAHQLFRETIRTRKMPFRDQYLWLDEGIAMYFESLTENTDFVTLGGFDARRLQYARIRKLREGFFIPTTELAAMSQQQLQRNQDIASIYSQSAGIAHMLMDADRGRMQSVVTEFMQAIHKRSVKTDSFEKLVGKTWPELDQDYAKFLEPNNNQVIDHLQRPDLRTELALPNADLSLRAFESIGQCEKLRWLDVTGSRITSDAILALRPCVNLKQIFLTRCQIDSATFSTFNQLPAIEELDLTASSVSNSDLAMLAQSPKLKVLRLMATRIDDGAVNALASMKSLTMVDISRTRISAGGAALIQQALPGAQVIAP